MSKRLVDSFGPEIVKTFEVHGFPKDISAARELANHVKGGRLKFEDWIIEVLLHGIMNERRNEMGFDGYRTFSIYEKKKSSCWRSKVVTLLPHNCITYKNC